MILSFYFLCSNPAIERVDHFPLGLERKLVRAVEKQCVEPPDEHCRPRQIPSGEYSGSNIGFNQLSLPQ